MVEDMLGETSLHSGHVTRNAERRTQKVTGDSKQGKFNFKFRSPLFVCASKKGSKLDTCRKANFEEVCLSGKPGSLPTYKSNSILLFWC